MTIKILTPESLVFEGEVDSLLVPGVSGEFQIFKNHAAVVSSLKNGEIRIFTSNMEGGFEKNFRQSPQRSNEYIYKIRSGVLEFNNNTGVLLCEE